MNVFSTIIGQRFTDFVRSNVEQRNQGIAEKNDLFVDMDPSILAVIRNSTAVSTQKGNSAALLKVGSKRRRTRVELEGLKQEEENRLASLEEKDARIAELQQ